MVRRGRIGSQIDLFSGNIHWAKVRQLKLQVKPWRGEDKHIASNQEKQGQGHVFSGDSGLVVQVGISPSNEDYQKDYAAFEERFGSWFKRNGYWWSRTGPAYGSDALFFLYSQIGPVANEICRRWDVSDPFDTSWEFDLNGERYEKGSCIGLPSFPYIKGYQIWDFEELDPSLPSSDDERLALLLKGVPDGIERPSWKDTTDRRLIRLPFDVTKSLETNIKK